jgi:glycosyltransferase involved in cell wall biosynthesis
MSDSLTSVAQPASDFAVAAHNRLPLSVCIIAKNAASQIGECIASVGFADEVLVVDSGSIDATVRIARDAGCRVIEHEWLGFGQQKQFAVSTAKHDWVLCLDVDERVTSTLATSIARALTTSDRAFRMRRRNRFFGRWLAHGEGYPDWSLRLFHRQHAAWSNDPVHETVITTYLQKQNRYSTLHAEALYAQGVRASYAKLFLSPVARFVKFYFFRRGFLDGGAGFAHVTIGCFAAFAKYAKLIELAQRNAADTAVK